MENILLIDFGSTYTKVSAINLTDSTILGTARAFTTIDTDIMEGLSDALGQLSKKIGHLNFSDKLASSSAAGGLGMVTVGLVPELTAKAAKMAALSAGAKILQVYSFELDHQQIQEIEALKPEIILLTGGTDGGNKKVVLANASALAKLDIDIPIIYAGNRSAAYEVANILSKTKSDVIICDNVMPVLGKLQIEPVREIIRKVFLKRIIKAKGMSQAKELVSDIIMPTPAAVLQAMELLAQGINQQKGLGDLLCVDVGGATTDVYSILDGMPQLSQVIFHGLEEPYAKRTVEGDLGVRYSLDSLIEAVGIKNICQWSNLSESQIEKLLLELKKQPYLLSKDEHNLAQLDDSLAKGAVKLAVQRHAGTIQVDYTAAGAIKLQEGKDLSNAQFIIGTGGAIIDSKKPEAILDFALKQPDETSLYLKPVQANFLVDQDYIIAAMGLLAQKYPETALKIMKDRLKTV